VSNRRTPRGQRATHSPQVMQRLSTTGAPVMACRRTSMAMGQLYEQIPHCTQRIESGTTCATESASRRFVSRWNRFLSMDGPRFRTHGKRRRVLYNGSRSPVATAVPFDSKRMRAGIVGAANVGDRARGLFEHGGVFSTSGGDQWATTCGQPGRGGAAHPETGSLAGEPDAKASAGTWSPAEPPTLLGDSAVRG